MRGAEIKTSNMKVNRTRLPRIAWVLSALAVGVSGAAGMSPSAGGQTPPVPGGQQARPAQAAPPGERTPAAAATPLVTQGVTFAPTMQFAKGQDRRYGAQSSLTFRFPGPNGAPASFASTTTMTLTLRFHARDTRPDGSVVVQALSEGGRLLDATGAFQNIAREPENTARSLTLDRLDRIVAFKDPAAKRGSAAGGLDALFNQSNLLIPLDFLPLPDKTVRVGESWTARYATPGKSGQGGEAAAPSDPTVEPTVNAPANQPVSDDVTATLTLLGREKIGDTDTIKIKQVLNVPYVAYTDAQGKPVEARNAKGRIIMRLTFTQMVNALPESGLMVRSQGVITGTVQFAGVVLAQLPGDTMTVSGQMIAVRLDDTPAPPAAKM